MDKEIELPKCDTEICMSNKNHKCCFETFPCKNYTLEKGNN